MTSPFAPARRSLSGAAMGLACAPASASVRPSPDAELIALSAKVVAASREYYRLASIEDDLTLAEQRAMAADGIPLAIDIVPDIHALDAEIADTPATTWEGLRAKAEALRHHLHGNADGPDAELMNGEDDTLAWSLARDVLRMTGRV